MQTISPSQTIESFIRDNGGRVRIYKNCMVAYGLQTAEFQDAVALAKMQGYTVTDIHADGINSFRYHKEAK